MSTLVCATAQCTTLSDGTNTTSSTNAIKGSAKAWVNFDGTTASPSTIRASYNVSSITKNGTGDYTVNFTTALADTNYSVSGNLMANIAPGNNMRCVVIYPNTTYSTSFATGSLRFLAQDYAGGVADALAVTVSIFR